MQLLLVHGAWHGAWCWTPVVSALEARGIAAKPIDLPGHGAGDKGGWRISLPAYARHVVAEADRMGAPVHVVGHSMGGAVISAAAELSPRSFVSLTYLAAFLLENGKSIVSMTKQWPEDLVGKSAKIDFLRGQSTITADAARHIFYGTCSTDAGDDAIRRLRPQPARPVLAGVNTTPANWGSLPRNYVFCEQDRAIPIARQRAMEAALPCGKTATLDTDHSPFLSAPDALADVLVGMIGKTH